MTGNELRKHRTHLGLNQTKLSEYWGVSRMTVVGWEGCKDKLVPHPKILKILVEDLYKKFGKGV